MNVIEKNTKNIKLEKVIYCHDCGKVIKNIVIDEKNQKVLGAKFYEKDGKWYAKDSECFKKDPVLRNFQTAEVFDRVVGYLRPVQQFNLGKKEEFKNKVRFKM